MMLRDHPEAITSPYLRQHLANPVDWHDWSDETLAKARELDRPLMVSIGYAACHWCHVMAHESFEDPAAAALLNRYFIPVKIDREERPDLDAIYMAACQSMNGHGGWPLTVFTTPDGRPYYAATYFPPVDRNGQPSFSRVVITLAEAFAQRRNDVESQADELSHAIGREARFVDLLSRDDQAPHVSLDDALHQLLHELGERFDALHGGFGPAPKFPRPSFVEACLAHHVRNADARSLTMATTTLDAMAEGGIYDHLVGGFARYSVDATWSVPHFEKMLSDQALLIRCYARAFVLTGNENYSQVVAESIGWVLNDLLLDDGALATSLDADANGVEGSHATFNPEDIAEALDGKEGVLSVADACAFFGVTHEGNFEDNMSVLRRPRGARLLRSQEEEATLQALLAHRRKRIQPERDNKVILEWNAMFLASLAECAAIFDRPDWQAAARALDVSLARSMNTEQGWLRSRLGVASGPPAMLADLAWLLEAKLSLFELTGQASDLEDASLVAQELLCDFEDPAGGFFTTKLGYPGSLMRAKEVLDGALPSATAITGRALLRLGQITSRQALRDTAARGIHAADALFERQASSVPDLIEALGYLECSVEVVIPGAESSFACANARTYVPYRNTVIGEHNFELCQGRVPTRAYVCRQQACLTPATDAATLEGQLLDIRRATPTP